jgi:hypothetical protein
MTRAQARKLGIVVLASPFVAVFVIATVSTGLLTAFGVFFAASAILVVVEIGSSLITGLTPFTHRLIRNGEGEDR